MRILYLNHICWEWIFQRPQILALKLEKDFECRVVNKKYIFGKKLASCNQVPKDNCVVWQLPKEDTFGFIHRINELIYGSVIKRETRNTDVVWVCHPLLFKYIPSDYRGKIVYDCMDDHTAMCDINEKTVIDQLEQALLSRADIIFASSQYLIDKKLKKYSPVLVRNAFDGAIRDSICAEKKYSKTYKMVYVGTISKWFDFELVARSIEIDGDLVYQFIGPVEKYVNKDEYENERILFYGIAEHRELPDLVKDCNALIMPFKICDIVLSVDPVKLYEYICYGKCIIAAYYPEIERFEPFIYFYHNEDEFFSLVQELKENGFKPKYSELQRSEFLKDNTWDKRYITVKNELEKYNIKEK